MSFRIRSKVSNPQKVFKDDINTYNVIVPESNSRDTTILQLTEERKKRSENKPLPLSQCRAWPLEPQTTKSGSQCEQNLPEPHQQYTGLLLSLYCYKQEASNQGPILQSPPLPVIHKNDVKRITNNVNMGGTAQLKVEIMYLNCFRYKSSNIARSSIFNEILDIFGILFSIWTKNTSVRVWIQGMMGSRLVAISIRRRIVATYVLLVHQI